jgi:hypothetical protein
MAGEPREGDAERSILEAGRDELSCQFVAAPCRERATKHRPSTSHSASHRQGLFGPLVSSSGRQWTRIASAMA